MENKDNNYPTHIENHESTIDNEIVLYQPDSTLSLDVRVENETVWLTQAQMVDLFQSTKQNISLQSIIYTKRENLIESQLSRIT